MTSATELQDAAADSAFAPTWHHLAGRSERAAVAAEPLGDDCAAFRLEMGEDTADLVVRKRGAEAIIETCRIEEKPQNADFLAALLEAVFLRWRDVERVIIPDPASCPPAAALAQEIVSIEGEARGVTQRAAFRQLPLLWRRAEAHTLYPTMRSAIGPADRMPPLRPPKPRGLLYERWLPEFGCMLSFRAIDRRKDLDLFHGWMNQGRVAYFWELAKPKQELDEYLAKQEADPHIFGAIGSFNGKPVGYFEFYWAKEDRLGPYYDSQDYDRGWHGLIGDARHLGRAKTLAWFRSLTHYLFLDDPRTERVVGEPRASHVKMLSYAAEAGYVKVKEFDFPHKRAALMCSERNVFFTETPL